MEPVHLSFAIAAAGIGALLFLVAFLAWRLSVERKVARDLGRDVERLSLELAISNKRLRAHDAWVAGDLRRALGWMKRRVEVLMTVLRRREEGLSGILKRVPGDAETEALQLEVGRMMLEVEGYDDRLSGIIE